MIQEDYIKRGIEKFKALDDKAQTDLIEYLTLKAVACGFIESYTVTPKIGFFSYMMPCWVHKNNNFMIHEQTKYVKNIQYYLTPLFLSFILSL